MPTQKRPQAHTKPKSAPQTEERDPLAELLLDAAREAKDRIVRGWLTALFEHGEQAQAPEPAARQEGGDET